MWYLEALRSRRALALGGMLLAATALTAVFNKAYLTSDDKKLLGISPHYEIPRRGQHEVRLAVLDNGFGNLKAGKESDYLPGDVTFINRYEITNPVTGKKAFSKGTDRRTDHGLRLAQILWSVTRAPTTLFLLNSNGFSNFGRAVARAIEERVDIILYSQNWDCCDAANNAIVDKAIQAGIIWVNAAGNNGSRILEREIRVGRNGYVILDDEGRDYVEFRTNFDNESLDVILSYKPELSDDEGLDQDLDLEIEDETGKRIENPMLFSENKTMVQKQLVYEENGKEHTLMWGARRQIKKGEDPPFVVKEEVDSEEEEEVPKEDPDEPADPTKPKTPRLTQEDPMPPATYQPREVIKLVGRELPPGKYYRMRVRVHRGVFAPSDRLKIMMVASGSPQFKPIPKKVVDTVEFRNSKLALVTNQMTSPANHPGVFTVGFQSFISARGWATDGKTPKPDVLMPKITAHFSDGPAFPPTENSTAAAYFAGLVAILKAEQPGMVTADLWRWVRGLAYRRAATSLEEMVARTTPSKTLKEIQRKFPLMARYLAEDSADSYRVVCKSPEGVPRLIQIDAFTEPLRKFFQKFDFRRAQDLSQLSFYVIERQVSDNKTKRGWVKFIAQGFGYHKPTKGQPRGLFPWEKMNLPPSAFVELRVRPDLINGVLQPVVPRYFPFFAMPTPTEWQEIVLAPEAVPCNPGDRKRTRLFHVAVRLNLGPVPHRLRASCRNLP